MTERAIAALLTAVAQVAPTGMQNSFASRAYAGYLLAEKGDQQPRSLAQAFLKPIRPHGEESVFDKAVAALESRRDNFDKVYGACADARQSLNVEAGQGSLAELIQFAAA